MFCSLDNEPTSMNTNGLLNDQTSAVVKQPSVQVTRYMMVN
jgi:hypothetical protein